MPCYHLREIKEIIRPYHEIDSSEWTDEVKRGACCTHDRDFCGGWGVRFSWNFTPENKTIVYLSDITLNDYMRVKKLVRECNCRDAEELESESRSQLILRRNAETERDDLQVTKRSLESRISDLQRERDSWRSSSWSLQTERDSLKDQVREKNDLIRSGEVVLRTTQNQLTTVQNQLTTKNTEYDDLNRRFNNLQIEGNNKDNEINSLKEELKSSQNVDLRYKERKRDELVRNFGLNRARVINLSDAYERLMRAREDYNRDNIANANNEIEVIKAELFQTNVNINDLHKIYKTCEKIAELKVKQEKLHEQQYQAHQEQPTNN